VSDRLEEARHELADVEAALEGAGSTSKNETAALRKAAKELTAEIRKLEAEARAAAGVEPPEPEVLDADPAEYRPPAGELVVPPLPPGSDELAHATSVVLDKHDEDQILATLEDRMDKVMLYDFSRSGTRIVNLSWAGTLECIRQMNQTTRARVAIDRESLVVEEVHEDAGNGPEWFYVATVTATDAISGLTTIGTSTEPKLMRMNNGTTKWDVFARTKAVNKAQRNALGMHIPERLRQAIIAMGKKDETRLLEVKHGAGATAAAQLPPPVGTPRAVELEKECRAVWQQIKGLAGWRDKMLPGQFNAKLSRARSSEVELESLRDALVSLHESLKAAA
jgi:hypothetical protein